MQRAPQEFAQKILFNMYIIFIHWKMVGLRAGQCFNRVAFAVTMRWCWPACGGGRHRPTQLQVKAYGICRPKRLCHQFYDGDMTSDFINI